MVGKIIEKTYLKKKKCADSLLVDILANGDANVWGVGPELQLSRVSQHYPQCGGDARSAVTEPAARTEDSEGRAVYWGLFL